MSLADGRSAGQHRLWRLRCDLTQALFLKQGAFWASVARLRRAWCVEPRTEDPVSTGRLRCPHDDPGWASGLRQARLRGSSSVPWRDDIAGLMDRHVPPGYRLGFATYRSGDRRALFSRNAAEPIPAAFANAAGSPDDPQELREARAYMAAHDIQFLGNTN